MKIAVTADLHLRSEHRERFENLERVCELLEKRGIGHLVIAGDCFDSGFKGYLEFDSLAGGHGNLRFHLVPGNHDPGISPALFNSGNITVYDSPVLSEIGGRQVLFLPFREGKTMGAVIEEEDLAGRLREGEWYLVSHGDFGRINRDENGNEHGYFPLTTGDLKRLSPRLMIFGHIHKPSDLSEPVLYPGSPWPLDINEKGQRRLLVVDTETSTVEPLFLDYPPVYEHATVFCIPDGSEIDQVKMQLEDEFNSWVKRYPHKNLREKLSVRVFLKGYTVSRQGIDQRVKEVAGSLGVTVDRVDIENLKTADDPDVNSLAVEVNKRIEAFSRKNSHGSDFIRSVREKAYEMIYDR